MKPNHYPKGELEPLKLIQRHNLPFELGNALKYIARCNHKGTKREDLEKALEYLRRYQESKAKPPTVFDIEKEWQISEKLAIAAHAILSNSPEIAKVLIQQEND